MEAFISWTSADRDVKNAIVEKLQESGINCWDSDENCVSAFSYECIEAIKNCEVFIVIISENSMNKGYVKNEVITARRLEDEGKLNILVYKITDKPYTDEFEFLLNHISFAYGNLVQRKENLMGESGIDIIVKRTNLLLQKRMEGNPEKPFDVKIPQIDGLKITKTGFFVENSRDDILSMIEGALDENNVVILKELFGFGKKSTIKKFAEQHKDKYDNVVIVDNEMGSLRQFFLNQLNFHNINMKVFENLEGTALIKEKFRLLEKLDEKTMLVIPNVTFETTPDEFICQSLTTLRCKIVLVTQESVEQYMEWFPVINLGRMNDEHLTELFFHHYPYAYDEDKEFLSEHLKKFFLGIGGHTKTVELTASVLSRELGVHPEEIPQYLSLQGSEGMQLKDRIMNQISYLFNMGNLSQKEIIILLVASYIAVPRASEANFRNTLKECGVNDWQLVMKLDKLRWIDVDMYARSVSIEPLIAKIIINKYPENYFVIYNCLKAVSDKSSKIVLNSSTKTKSWYCLEHILSSVGFDESARIINLLKEHSIDEENFDASLMKQALEEYDNRYSRFEDALIEEANAFGCATEEDFGDDEHHDGEETNEQSYTLLSCIEFVEQIMSVFLPLAKLVASDIDTKVFLDFSQESQNVFLSQFGTETKFFDIEDIIGLTKEELYEFLENIREEMETNEDFEEDGAEYLLILQSIFMLDALYNRDFAEIINNFTAITKALAQCDSMPQDTEIMVASVYGVILRVFLNMGAYHSVINYCEKALAHTNSPASKTAILNVYIEALQWSDEYGDKLYWAYEEVLKNFNKTSGDAFASREEANNEKKYRVLSYAYDLAIGERVDEALNQFAAAQKLGEALQSKNTVRAAEKIVKALLNSGEFKGAIDFINEYFSSEYIAFLRKSVADNEQAILDDFEAYKNFSEVEEEDFSAQDETKYISYYNDYSRKNNSLQEHRYYSVADKAVTFDFGHLTNDEIKEHALELKARAKKEKLLSLAPEIFALASEAGFRVLGYKHHYVQYMGAAAMADGKVAEILNGEGKTYTIVLVAFLNFIYGKKVFVVDGSPFLTKRNFEWMHGVYKLLGMSCEYIESNKQFFDMQHKSQADVIYISVKHLIFGFLACELEFGFKRDYIKYGCAIVDEIDSVIIDEALQSYDTIATESDYNVVPWCEKAYMIAKEVAFDEDCYSYSSNSINFKQDIYPYIERHFGVSYEDINDVEKIRRIEEILRIALLCCNHYEKGNHYYIEKGFPVYENTEKGVFEYFDSMYEYFFAKINNLDTSRAETELKTKRVVLDSICVKDMFKRFEHVCGTTATAVSFKKEFEEIYNLDYVAVPPFAPCIRVDTQSPIYMREEAKAEAIVDIVAKKHEKGQPVLIIAQSVRESEKYSKLLKIKEIPHKLLNAKNSDDSSDMIAFAGEPYSVLVTTFLVNRGADIKLGGNAEIKTRRELVGMGVDITGLEELIYTIPSAEQMELPLFKKYYSLLEKNKLLVAKEKAKVIEAGGLCVVGTSFFSEPRTEQQTRGRSGRQGEIGESIIFRSLDDEVMKRFMPQGFVEKLKNAFGDVSIMEHRILNKQLQVMQQKLHNRHFFNIRTRNSRSKYIDAGRKDFIAKKFALCEGSLTVDDIIREWAKNDIVKEEISLLQKGLKTPGKAALHRLYSEYETVLSSAKKARLEQALFEAFKAKIEPLYVKIGSSGLLEFMERLLKHGWKDYIEIVDKTIKKIDISDRSLEKFFAQERSRIFVKTIELLLHQNV